MGSINYPPKKIYNPSALSKLNYDHIILWMLHNNDSCKWSDFRQEALQISTGTLSRHLERLKRKGFVDNFTRGHYRITPEGKKQFYILSSAKKKARILNYPPKIILKSGRNYSHWILWMVYNNNYCKRSDFLEDPLSINQSSLSKNLNFLLENGFISKEEGKYAVTPLGKSEYSEMLQEYDLDRQTILEEEGKRIENITKKTINFFERYNIEEKDIQFRFLKNILTLEYEKVKSILKEEELFHKILLFLSINHPDQYPNFISSEDFSKFYKIKKTTLDYYIDEISEGKIYPIKFFKLTHQSGGEYFFQSDGKLEKMLRVITENEINKNSYMNKLYSKPTQKEFQIDMSFIINNIVDESSEFLFNKDLNLSLREFLPDYIKYLAYNIETKKELKRTYDKLEGIIWQDLTEVFDSEIDVDLKSQYEEKIKEVNRDLKLSPKNVELYRLKVRILIYFNQYNEVLLVLNKMLEIFPEKEIEIMIQKASIYKRKKDLNTGLEIIEDLLKKYPENIDLMSFKAFWFQYLDRKEEALELIENVIKKDPDNGIYYDNYGEILMYFEEYEEATKKFLKSIFLKSDQWYFYQTYIKLGICYESLGNTELAFKNLKKGKELTEKSSIDPDVKQKWLQIADLFLKRL